MKGKSRHKRKKTRSRLLWIASAVIGVTAVTAAVCVAGIYTKGKDLKTPEEFLTQYMNHIPKQKYHRPPLCRYAFPSVRTRQED